MQSDQFTIVLSLLPVFKHDRGRSHGYTETPALLGQNATLNEINEIIEF